MLRLISLSILFVLGCGGGDGVGRNGDVVGGPCTGAGDCDFQCATGGEFPQGTCFKPCNTDDDCPDGTYCIDKDGGMCMLGCDKPDDCRGGYNCEGETNRTHGGDSLVCSAD